MACTRPAVVFGHGRKRGSVLWAGAFVTLPALGPVASCHFPEIPATAGSTKTTARSNWCAWLSSPRSLTSPTTPAASETAEELASAVRCWLPDAQIEFDETKPTTPLIDWQDGSRLRRKSDSSRAAHRWRAGAYQRGARGGGPPARVIMRSAIQKYRRRQLSAADPGRGYDEEATLTMSETDEMMRWAADRAISGWAS